MNNITLTGRITMDEGNQPENFKIYGQTQNGRSFYNNSLAVDMGYKSKDTGEWVNRTEFFNIRAYAGTADFFNKYIKKGEKILITGALRTEEWETQENKKAKRYFIVVNSVEKFVKSADKPSEISEELPFQ